MQNRGTFDELLEFGGAESGSVDGGGGVEAVIVGEFFEGPELRRKNKGGRH